MRAESRVVRALKPKIKTKAEIMEKQLVFHGDLFSLDENLRTKTGGKS